MEATLSALRQFLCDGGFEYLLVVPGQSMGKQLLDLYAARFGGVMGLRVETPATLAQELCARRGISRPLLGDGPAALLVLRLLQEGCAQPQQPLAYFSALGESCLTLSTARELLRVFHLLEEEGLDGLPAPLLTEPRLADLDHLYRRFQAEKQAQGLWDRFDLFRAAEVSAAEEPLSIPTALCGSLTARGVARRFLETVCPEPAVLPIPMWDAVTPTPSFWLPQTSAPIAATLRFARGYGQENEALFPLYDLLEQGYPLGQVSIVCTSSSYLPLLADHAARLGIPLTLGDGLPLDTAPLCQLVGQLAAWCREDCPVEGLADLMAGGLVFPHGAALLRFLRKWNAGFRLERYEACFRRALEQLPSEDESGLRTNLEDWLALTDQLQTLFHPDTAPAEGLALLGKLLTRCYVRFHPQQGAGAYAALMELADQLLAQQRCAAFADFLPLLLELTSTRVWQSASPRDGAVHVSLLARDALPDRPHTYVLGLGRDNLTAPVWESPLLRAEEQEAIGLPAADREAELPLCRLAQLLALAQGQVVLSYPCYDTARMLSLPPAAAYEQLRGNQDAPLFDYRRAVGFAPAEGWLAGDAPAPLPTYPDTPLSLPQFLQEHRFSASALEIALECPRRFYFQYVLGIPQPDRPLLSHEHWLAPNQLGSLVHLALERHFSAVIGGTASPDFDALWRDCLAEAQEQYPCLSPQLMERDGLRAQAMARQAVRYYTQQQNGSVPLATELPFGGAPVHRTVDGTPFTPPEDFRLTLQDCSMRFTGTVDRLDKLPTGGLAILDYKTGSASRFIQGLDHKIQYYLYALAMEQLLGQPVERADYLLLSPDGVRTVTVDHPAHQPDCAARLDALLKVLGDPESIRMKQPVWENGAFTCPEEDEGRQKKLSACADYCPYAGICQEVDR